MSAEFLILDNEKAAKLFSQSGHDAVPEEVFPVKLERVVFRKTYTEMRLACWKLEMHHKSVFLRMDTGEILERPRHCSCIGLDPSEGLILGNDTIVSMTYFSPVERRFRFERKYLKSVRYLKVIIPRDL